MLHYEGATKDFRQSSCAKVGIFGRKTKDLIVFCDYLGAAHVRAQKKGAPPTREVRPFNP